MGSPDRWACCKTVGGLRQPRREPDLAVVRLRSGEAAPRMPRQSDGQQSPVSYWSSTAEPDCQASTDVRNPVGARRTFLPSSSS